jgi:hypothetical protein
VGGGHTPWPTQGHTHLGAHAVALGHERVQSSRVTDHHLVQPLNVDTTDLVLLCTHDTWVRSPQHTGRGTNAHRVLGPADRMRMMGPRDCIIIRMRLRHSPHSINDQRHANTRSINGNQRQSTINYTNNDNQPSSKTTKHEEHQRQSTIINSTSSTSSTRCRAFISSPGPPALPAPAPCRVVGGASKSYSISLYTWAHRNSGRAQAHGGEGGHGRRMPHCAARPGGRVGTWESGWMGEWGAGGEGKPVKAPHLKVRALHHELPRGVLRCFLRDALKQRAAMGARGGRGYKVARSWGGENPVDGPTKEHALSCTSGASTMEVGVEGGKQGTSAECTLQAGAFRRKKGGQWFETRAGTSGGGGGGNDEDGDDDGPELRLRIHKPTGWREKLTLSCAG